jgi:predicted GTPase
VKARPPTFAAFVRGSESISEPGSRFLASSIRKQLGFEGVPLRLLFRYNKRLANQQPRRKVESLRKSVTGAGSR